MARALTKDEVRSYIIDKLYPPTGRQGGERTTAGAGSGGAVVMHDLYAQIVRHDATGRPSVRDWETIRAVEDDLIDKGITRRDPNGHLVSSFDGLRRIG